MAPLIENNEAFNLLRRLIKNKTDFIGTRKEMRLKLDDRIKVGDVYCFHSRLVNNVQVGCGLVTGRLMAKLYYQSEGGELAGYSLAVINTNTSLNAPRFGEDCIVKSPIDLISPREL